jgi:hypothetical protein
MRTATAWTAPAGRVWQVRGRAAVHLLVFVLAVAWMFWWASLDQAVVIQHQVPHYGPCDTWKPGPAFVSTAECRPVP